MVFSSVEFLFLFLPAILLTQVISQRNNLVIAAFSLLFYFVGEGWYTWVVLLSLAMNFAFGLAIEDAANSTRRRVFLTLAVSANLTLLAYFKYAAFFAESVIGLPSDGWIKSIHLPLGISFFTFHALSYLIDVYRADARAERSFIRLAVYILMFPQLIAGPILRYSKIAGQLVVRTVTTRHVYFGLMFFCIGLGQKVLIADTMAGIADPLFAQWKTLSTEAAWTATVSYTFQIFFDFGGYSNMAIGLAMLCGFDFPMNFNNPYISRSITEFWRRWHMTLSSWFRDYLYVPLGGNRYGTLKTYRNLLIVFLLCGLWHGAAWTFVLWGIYHGILLIIERVGLTRLLAQTPAPIQHVYAMLAVMIGWVLFRAESVDQAKTILGKMFGFVRSDEMPFAQFLTCEGIATLAAAAVLSTPLLYNLTRSRIAWHTQRPWPAQESASAYVIGLSFGILIFVLSAMKVLTGSYSPFIYFRF